LQYDDVIDVYLQSVLFESFCTAFPKKMSHCVKRSPLVGTPRTKKRKRKIKATDSINSALKDQRIADGLETGKSNYVDLEWVLGTSDVVERCFSHAKKVLTDVRLGMSPYMFEIIMFLKVNMDHWTAHDVAKAIQMNTGGVRSARELEDFEDYDECTEDDTT
jgi:hypothetical protein